MSDYPVIITTHAIQAISEIRDYIAVQLLNPTAARTHLELFREEIKKLADDPYNIKTIDESPWSHEMGVRKIRVKNYYIYYWIDEEISTVYVTDVIYVGRDQPRWLRKMPMK